MIKRLAIGIAGAALCALAVPLHAGGWLIYSDLYYVGALSFLACIGSFVTGVMLIKDALFYPQGPYVVCLVLDGFNEKIYCCKESEARRLMSDAKHANVPAKLDHRLRSWF